VRTFVISNEAVHATDTDLSARVRFVLGCIVHFGYVDEFQFVDRLRRPNGTTTSGVVFEGVRANTAVLRHTISERNINLSHPTESSQTHPGSRKELRNGQRQNSKVRTFDDFTVKGDFQEIKHLSTDWS